MKNITRVSLLSILLITLFSFNTFAMTEKYVKDPERPTPQNEKVYEDVTLNQSWTWLNDELCVRFRPSETIIVSRIQRLYDAGVTNSWRENENGNWKAKERESYSGKWSQTEDGTWSFQFDDKTIPVGVTKIDGVLYAFTGYGELKADYEYYPGLKTEADGLVKSDNPEFVQWLSTQYLPECTSHE